uniref:Uncharacterized protein n=1 Tax=Siphoviridae sp. ctBCr48 TaxID=2827802 RepID=A0A8S5SH14_9CAUD|nr:MAG TPA: hypothetical protein [Siphoviridae sp. ctBCr48]
MKGFIEVNLIFNGTSLLTLINVNTIESVVRSNGLAVIYSSIVETNGDRAEQLRYPTQNTYEEVKAMIEEAMK